MKKFADLHVHTFHSDSTFTPEQVVDVAHKGGLAGIAITDHDNVAGIDPSIGFAGKYGMEIIAGVELTAEVDNLEIHILGYFIDWKAEWFEKKLVKIRQARLERIHAMIEKLKKQGVDIDPKKVFALSGPGAVGRLHLATVLYNEGIISSISEAFRKYIGQSAPCYVRKYKLTPKEAMDMILKLGGVPVLAHPHILGRDDLIPGFIKDGLRGMEVYHTEHSSAATSRYRDIASRYNLVMTGGSDCHGMGKGRVLLGKVKVPYSLVETLREESAKIRASNEKK
ncbi:MAG: PHP domain-containing protein [Candidatus Omnitrophica bacterium]|nr:PHP domain-containing protein [Candidatus Omnitrophota bacterium]